MSDGLWHSSSSWCRCDMLTRRRNKTAILCFTMVAAVLIGQAIISVSTAEAELANTTSSTGELQALIDQAHPEERIRVPSGVYEGSLILSKKITLEAETEGSVSIVNANPNTRSVIHIAADDVEISGIQIINESPSKIPALLITGDRTVVENMNIQTASQGIVLEDANDGQFRSNIIQWSDSAAGRAVKLFDKGNGIDLYNSHRNIIRDNTIQRVHDGIYMENSDDNRLTFNVIEHSRYGIHSMYSKGAVIQNNQGNFNYTGAMIMASREVELTGNVFRKQSENVNSQGILIFQVQDSLFKDNKVIGNRVGLYLEQSENNRMENNEIADNFIGIQLLGARDNLITGNTLSGNVAETLAQDSANNSLDRNYWDSFQGIDTDGDGISNIAYAINPFFQGLIKKRPAFQLFFQSPSMVFLEGLYQADQNTWTTDEEPLMVPLTSDQTSGQKASSTASGLIGAAFLILTLSILQWARRRE